MEELKQVTHIDNVKLGEDGASVVIIDQTLLPATTKLVALRTAQEIWDAIYLLKVRGAPAIGVTAAFGIYVLAKQIDTEDYDFFYREFVKEKSFMKLW